MSAWASARGELRVPTLMVVGPCARPDALSSAILGVFFGGCDDDEEECERECESTIFLRGDNGLDKGFRMPIEG